MAKGKHRKRSALHHAAAQEAAQRTLAARVRREEAARAAAEAEKSVLASVLAEVAELERLLRDATADEVATLLAEIKAMEDEIGPVLRPPSKETQKRGKQLTKRGTSLGDIERAMDEARGTEGTTIGRGVRMGGLGPDAVRAIQKARGLR